MLSGKPLKLLVFSVGTCLALAGLLVLVVAVFAPMSPDTALPMLVGLVLILASAPAIAFPLSSRWAKVIWLLFVAAFAVLAIWLGFAHSDDQVSPLSFTLVAVIFSVLVLFRVLLVFSKRLRGPAA